MNLVCTYVVKSTHTMPLSNLFTLLVTFTPLHPHTHHHTAQSYHVLEQDRLICIDCLNKDGPIYNELEAVHSDSELLDHHTPPIPPRRRAPKQKDPIYERVGSVHRKHLQATRFSMSSEEGSYITSELANVMCHVRTACMLGNL